MTTSDGTGASNVCDGGVTCDRKGGPCDKDPISKKELKRMAGSAIKAVEEHFKLNKLLPRICHNQEAKLTLAWTIKENVAPGNLDVDFAFFFCGPRDSWIRSRGYAGALTRLYRRPVRLIVTGKKALTREDFSYVGNMLVKFVSSIQSNRQVKTLSLDLIKAIEAHGLLCMSVEGLTS